MSQLKLKTLELEGFRSFREPAQITFPDDGTILIQGQYVGSLIGSGSGKSSIVMAVAFALGFTTPPATELKNWNSKKLRVSLVITDGKEDYQIVRDPKLTIIYGGNTYSGKSAEERLAQIMKIDISLAETLAYRPQRKPGTFLNATDSAKKEFLSSVLGLTAIEAGQDQLNQQASAAKQKSEILESKKTTLNSFISSNPSSEDQYLSAKAAYENASLELNRLNAAIQSSGELAQKQTRAQSELYNADTLRQRVAGIQSENHGIKGQIVALMAEIEKLKAAQCPTCHREWDSAGETIARKEQNLAGLKDRFLSNVEFEKQSAPVIAGLPAMRAALDGIQAQITSLRAPITHAQQSVSSAKSQLEMATNLRNQVINAKTYVDSSEAELRALANEVEVLGHAAEILGRNGFLSVIFDEVLSEVETRSNDMISKIPNVARFTLKLSSTATLKSGASKKTIASTLYVDGEEVALSTVSGGQRCALELCTDLAISETIRSRSGSPIGWTVLDEAMDGLDTATKQEALQMILETIKGQVVVIDHSTEVQEGATHIVQVQFDGRDSKVL